MATDSLEQPLQSGDQLRDCMTAYGPLQSRQLLLAAATTKQLGLSGVLGDYAAVCMQSTAYDMI